MRLSRGFSIVSLCIFVFLLTLSFSHQAFAITYLDDAYITSNTMWTKAESPYVISGDLIIESGVTLTIEPGVVVKFSEYASFHDYGKVNALGTAEEKIYFTSIYNDEVFGDTDGDGGKYTPSYFSWQGLYFHPGASYDFRNFEASYLVNALSSSGSSGNFENVSFSTSWQGINLFDQSSLIANGLSINDVYYDSALSIISSSTASVNNLSVKNIYYKYTNAIDVFNNSSIDLKNASILEIEEGFINLNNNSSASISNVDVRNILGSAIIVYNKSKISIENSTFEDVGDSNRIAFLEAQEGSSVKFSSSTVSNIMGRAFNVYRDSTLDIDHININDIGFNGSGGILCVFNNSTSTIANSNFKNIYANYGFEVYGGYLNLKDVVVEDNFGRDCTLCVSDDYDENIGRVEVSNTSFIGGGIGLEAAYNSEAKISKSIIKDFSDTGILFFGNPKVVVEDSEISGNRIGIVKDEGSIEIKNSSISNNIEAGVSDWGDVYNNMKAIGNYWGDASGPYNSNLNATGTGNSVVDGVEFIPWLKEDPTKAKPNCCSNVVFIPGIESSRLYTKGLLSENQLWEPNWNADVEKLFLDASGESVNKNIYTRDIIRKTNVGMGVLDSNIYKSFADMMDGLVSEKKVNLWEALPYDWRMDLNKIVNEPVKLENGGSYNLIDEIIKVASSSQTGKVSIVTHSNGGLVAKTLISELKKRGEENLIDQLVMVASPELGTPSAVAGLLHGDEQEIVWGLLMNKVTARTLGENMMGAYNLLPSTEYFKKVASPVVEFDSSVDKVKNFRTLYGDKIDTAEKLNSFLSGADGRVEPVNSDTDTPNVLKNNLLATAVVNHSVVDNFVFPENIKVTELAGWGVSTIRGLKYFGREDCVANITTCSKTTVLDRKPLFTTEGDQTVVSPSATVGSSTYYLDMKKIKQSVGKEYIHKNILETSSTLGFLKNTLMLSTSTLPQYISKEKPVSKDKMLELALHSPVSIDVYDSAGRHTGLIKNPNINSDLQAFEESIPGSRYIEFGEGKYVLLDDSTAYTVKLQGLDVGTFTLESNTLSSGGDTISSSQFVDIPTSPDMKGEITMSASSTASTSVAIRIDVNGDGKNDFTINPNDDFEPIVYLQILRKTVETFSASQKTKNEIYKKIDAIIKSLQKNRTKNAILKIKQFSRDFAVKGKHTRDQIENKHKGEKDWVKNKKNKKLNQTDSEIMLQMLNRLLNNLI